MKRSKIENQILFCGRIFLSHFYIYNKEKKTLRKRRMKGIETIQIFSERRAAKLLEF